MSDDGKCYAATPAATLEEHILNSNIAKSDTEWWAHREITRLRAELAAANTRMSKLDFERTAAELERDALRAELAAVTAERDRLREAFEKAVNDMRPMLRSMISRNEAAEIVRRAARAALEGVTEPASLKGPDERLNLRNAECLPSTAAVLKSKTPKENKNGNQ